MTTNFYRLDEYRLVVKEIAMQKKLEYSEKKFSGFSPEKKIRVLVQIVDATIKSWNESEERTRLLESLRFCLTFIEEVDIIDKFKKFKQNPQYHSISDFVSDTAEFMNKYGFSLRDYDLMDRVDNIAKKKIPLIVVLDNLRSAFNVGSILRTSECYGIQKIYLCGYTPVPDDIKVLKTAMGTADKVIWEQRDDIVGLIDELKSVAKIFALETGDTPINSCSIPEPAVLILGNEAFGIRKEVLEKVDGILTIPITGWKESLNVGVAFGIACYEINNQWNSKGDK